MKHRIGFNRLNKNVSHRHALYRSMATALFKYERIKTTKPKAREIRRVAEKMISRARTDSVHNRRIIARKIRDKAVVAKLFTDIAPRFKTRPGGYTRILKLGQRYGDASEMVLLELVERAEAAPRRRKKQAAMAETEPGKESPAVPEASDEKPAKEEKATKAAKTRSASAKGTSVAKTKARTSAKAAAADTPKAGAGEAKPAAKPAGKPAASATKPAGPAVEAAPEGPETQAHGAEGAEEG